MFPVYVPVHNMEQLKAVSEVLGTTPSAPAAEAPATPTKPPRAAKQTPAGAPAGQTPPPPAPPPATAPVQPAVSPSAKALLKQLEGPLQDLCLKDHPKAEAILAEYGVERFSLIPEKDLPAVILKVQTALDPDAAERARLAAIDAQKTKTSLF